MRCPIEERKTETLLAYCSGKLEFARAAEVAAHVAACPECRQFAAAQNAVWEALDQWEPAAVSADFDAKLYARIELEENKGWWRRLVRRWDGGSRWLRPALPVALASLLVAGAILIEHPRPSVPPSAERGEAVDVDRIEKALDDLDMVWQLNLPPRADGTERQSM
jgi:anti-sigma factor RsiW